MPADMVAYNRGVIEDFRTNGAPPGRPLLLLTTIGRRSGEPRTSPMMYVRDPSRDDRLLVIASNSGAPDHPLWFRNLAADPHVHVEVGDRSYDAIAVVTDGDEHDALWAHITTSYPFFIDHQAGVERTIPVVALAPAQSATGSASAS
jgi:deazaflavin-dependent oxidoreductase (nitroreductase family)